MDGIANRNPLYDPMDEGSTGRALAEGRLTHIDITEGLRQLCVDDDSTSRASTPRPSVAQTTKGMGTSLPRRPRGEKTRPRPSLLKKAATAPPGGIYILSNVPEPPRRAISARVAKPGSPQEPRNHQGWVLPHLSRLSLYRTGSESRSLITRRKSIQKSGGKVGLKPRGKVWRMMPATSVRKYEALSSALDETQSGVLFEKRKKTGGPQHMEILKTQTHIADFNARALPDTPGSMVNTSRELYPPSASRREVRRPLHEMPTTMIRANSSSGASAQAAESHQPDPEPARRRPSQVILKSGSILAIVPPEETAWKRQVYWPGPIQLAQQTAASAVSRKGSVATLEPFIGAVEAEERRPSDDAALDGIVAYFKELNVIDPATEHTLDQFWRPEDRLRRSLVEQGEQLGAVKSRQATPPSQPLASSPGFDPPPPIPKLVPPDEERKTRSRTSSQSRIKLRRLFHSATSIL